MLRSHVLHNARGGTFDSVEDATNQILSSDIARAADTAVDTLTVATEEQIHSHDDGHGHGRTTWLFVPSDDSSSDAIVTKFAIELAELSDGTFSVDRMLACRQFLFPGAEPVYDDDRLEEENGKETDSDEDES